MSGDEHARQHAGMVFRTTLAPLLALADAYPNATELCIDGSFIKLDLGNEWQRFDFSDFPGLKPRDVQAAASAAATFADITLGPKPPQKPTMSVWMPPDLRVSAVCPPVSPHWNVSIRFLRSRALTLEDYVQAGVMTESQALELRLLLSAGANLVISGGTSSGKTTMLRCLLEMVKHERLVIIEDTPELNVPGSDIMHWATIQGTDMAALLNQAMRMRPDRIVVGEVRGPEALEVCTAANTGTAGTMSTLHSNGGPNTLRRLHNLVRRAQPNFLLEDVISAVDYDVHLEGRGRLRRLSSIWKVPKE